MLGLFKDITWNAFNRKLKRHSLYIKSYFNFNHLNAEVGAVESHFRIQYKRRYAEEIEDIIHTILFAKRYSAMDPTLLADNINFDDLKGVEGEFLPYFKKNLGGLFQRIDITGEELGPDINIIQFFVDLYTANILVSLSLRLTKEKEVFLDNVSTETYIRPTDTPLLFSHSMQSGDIRGAGEDKKDLDILYRELPETKGEIPRTSPDSLLGLSMGELLQHGITNQNVRDFSSEYLLKVLDGGIPKDYPGVIDNMPNIMLIALFGHFAEPGESLKATLKQKVGSNREIIETLDKLFTPVQTHQRKEDFKFRVKWGAPYHKKEPHLDDFSDTGFVKADVAISVVGKEISKYLNSIISPVIFYTEIEALCTKIIHKQNYIPAKGYQVGQQIAGILIEEISSLLESFPYITKSDFAKHVQTHNAQISIETLSNLQTLLKQFEGYASKEIAASYFKQVKSPDLEQKTRMLLDLARWYHSYDIPMPKSLSRLDRDMLKHLNNATQMFHIYASLLKLSLIEQEQLETLLLESFNKKMSVKDVIERTKTTSLLDSGLYNDYRILKSVIGLGANLPKYIEHYSKQIAQPKVGELKLLNLSLTPKLRFRVLDDQDPYHFMVGGDTDCCQILAGLGEDAAIQSYINHLAGVVVLEWNRDGLWETMAQSYFHWVPEQKTFILDNVEHNFRLVEEFTKDSSFSNPQKMLANIYAIYAQRVKGNNPDIKGLFAGQGYSKIGDNDTWETTNLEKDQRHYHRYSDPDGLEEEEEDDEEEDDDDEEEGDDDEEDSQFPGYTDFDPNNALDLTKPKFQPKELNVQRKVSYFRYLNYLKS